MPQTATKSGKWWKANLAWKVPEERRSRHLVVTMARTL